MKTTMLEKLLNREILSGVYLSSSLTLMQEQKHWDEDDFSKHVDFSRCSYWLTYNDGTDPDGIDDDQDLLNYLSETKNLKNFIKFYFRA